MTLPRNVDDIFPLSPMQHLMLLHAMSADGNGVLFNQVCYDVRGPLDAGAFGQAWEDVVARHPALRTAFLWEGLPQPLQVVRTTVTLPFRTIDLSDRSAADRETSLDNLRREDLETSLTLGRAPLTRGTLVRLGDDHHRFMWAIHHLVVDRWSHAIIFDDLRACYEARVRGATPQLPPVTPFRDYIAWITQQDEDAAERFWRDELSGLRRPTPLTGDRGGAGRGNRITTAHALSLEKTAAIRSRAARWRTTPGAVMLSAVGLLLASRTGCDDVVCGLTVSGRPSELTDAAAVVGSFVNNVPARFQVRREHPIDMWVREVHRAEGRRQSFVHVSPVRILEWSDVPAGRPLFDMLLLLNLSDESGIEWPGLRFAAQSATLDAGYPLVLAISAADDRYVLSLVHDEDFADPKALLAALAGLLLRLTTAADGQTVGDFLPSPLPPSPIVEAQESADQWGHERAGSMLHSASRTSGGSEGSMADALLHAWRDVLGVAEVGLDDDFLAMGGTSLQAAQLFTRVERICGRSLPLSTLFAAGSVRALLEAIDRPVPRTGSLVRMRSTGKRAPLYAVPGIGGNVVGLSGLARHLGSDQPFCVFESPGLDGREVPLTSIEAIAQRYADELVQDPAREYHLLGICWGAAVAFEMARRLGALGRPPMSLLLMDPAVLLRDTDAKPARAETAFLRRRLELYWDEFREGDWRSRSRLLVSKARRAANVLTGGDAEEQSLGELNRRRVREANVHAVTRYDPHPLAVRAHLFLTADRDVGADADPRLEWLRLITPTPGVVTIGGVDSGDAISPTHVGGFSRALRAWLDASSAVRDVTPAPR